MKILSPYFLVIIFFLPFLFLSCETEKEPTPPAIVKNLVTGKPTIAGISGATVSVDTVNSFYTITVPVGTDIKALKLSIPTSSGAAVTPDPSVAQDYTNPVKFTVTSSSGSKQVITVIVVVQQAIKSPEKQITAFKFDGLNPVVQGVIDQANHKITATVPIDSDLTKLAPTINLSNKATVSPASGLVQNFTNPVNYSVTAEDGSNQIYEVTAKKAFVASNKPCLITRIDFLNRPNEYIEFEYNTDARISKMIRHDVETWTSYFEYDQSGEITKWKNSDGIEYQYTYTNGKLSGYKSYEYSLFKVEGSTADLGYILNDKNEVVEVKGSFKFEYTGGNITRAEVIDEQTKIWTTYKLDYDNKNHFLSGSEPKGFALFLYAISGLGYYPYFFAATNNLTGFSASDGTTGTTNFSYNQSGFPIEIAEKTDVTFKLTYSNCQ